MIHTCETARSPKRSPHGWGRIGIRVAAVLAFLVVVSVPFAAATDSAPVESGETLTVEQANAIAREIIPQVEQIRGLEFKREVPIEIIDQDRALEHIKKRLDQFQTPEELAHAQIVHELLGLIPEGLDLVETVLELIKEQAGGFYDPESGTFYVLDSIPRAVAPIVISHELTHALEDQHFGLDKRLDELKGDDDRLLAQTSVHEGSATCVMTLHMSRAMVSGEMDPTGLEEFFESEQEKAAKLEQLPVVFRRQLIAPYMLGAEFLLRGNMLRLMANGFPVEDVNRVFDDPPSSSEQILHPQKYWDEEARDDPRPVDLEDAGKLLGRGWMRAMRGTLGELTLGILVGAPTPATDSQDVQQAANWTNDAASGWGGDAWELWTRGERAVLLVGTVWDSPADAREFAAALAPDGGLTWKVVGDTVAIVAGDGGKKTDRLLSRVSETLAD